MSHPQIQPSNLAGSWYPADARELRIEVERCLGEERALDRTLRAILVPHAGYRYSGIHRGSGVREARARPLAAGGRRRAESLSSVRRCRRFPGRWLRDAARHRPRRPRRGEQARRGIAVRRRRDGRTPASTRSRSSCRSCRSSIPRLPSCRCWWGPTTSPTSWRFSVEAWPCSTTRRRCSSSAPT